jgi:hypothetical protein
MHVSVEDLIADFATEFSVTVTKDHRFGSASLGWLGVCDGAAGVQWNTWLHRREDSADVVNLEGLKYDDWPIARFIEREFRHPRLFEVTRQLAAPESIQMMFHRDVWRYAARPAIEERHIGLSRQALAQVDPNGWKRTLQEAYECLDPDCGHRRRGRQIVTTKGGRVELSVSPHLLFRQRISDAAEGQALQPLYDYVKSNRPPSPAPGSTAQCFEIGRSR